VLGATAANGAHFLVFGGDSNDWAEGYPLRTFHIDNIHYKVGYLLAGALTLLRFRIGVR
jgi:hypothetical protein